MTVFRWIIGGFAALFALTALLSLVIGVVGASQLWYDRAKRVGQWVWMVALLWFNLEVWGRVAWTLVTWNS